MRRPENRLAPMPESRPQSYDDLCEAWARSLSEPILRSMASDYRMGKDTPDNEDAFYEYQRRERLGLLKPIEIAGSTLKTSKGRKGNRSRK